MAEQGIEWVDEIRQSITSYLFVLVAFGLLVAPTGVPRLLALPVVFWGGLQTLKIIGRSIPFVSMVRLIVLAAYFIAFVSILVGGWLFPKHTTSKDPRKPQQPPSTLVVEQAPRAEERSVSPTIEERAPKQIAPTLPPSPPSQPTKLPAAKPEVPKPGKVEPPPPPKPEPKSTPEIVRDLILTSRQAEMRRDLDGAMRHYAKAVTYFNKLLRKSEVREDKARYFTKWPTLIEFINPAEVEAYKRPDERWVVSFPSRFRVESTLRGEWFSGVISNQYVLEESPGQVFTIIEQVGSVSDTSKGKLTPTNP